MKKNLKKLFILCLIIMQASVMAASGNSSAQKEEAEEKILYLTFDDGPSQYTERLLDLLDQHGLKATFFMLETEMKRYPDVIKRMAEEGHAIGLHGVSHEKDRFYAGDLSPVKEMDQANDTLESIIGERTCLIRTPYGSSPYLTVRQENALESHHYILWDWNVDSRDWCYRNAQKTFCNTTKMIAKSNKEPMVVLFHDINHVLETMELMTHWMDENHYTSKAITTDLRPVKLYRKK